MQIDVIIREVGSRDGLQLVSKFMNSDTKIEWSPNKYRLVLKKLR
jgi:hypothetical protein